MFPIEVYNFVAAAVVMGVIGVLMIFIMALIVIAWENR